MAAEENTITGENLIEETLIEEIPMEESRIRNITDTRKLMEPCGWESQSKRYAFYQV